MNSFSLDAPPPRRMFNFTPLRYPGGKGKLATYVKLLLKDNRLLDGSYVEPYAGGAAIALELLFHEYISRAYINDVSRPIYAFWHSVLHEPESLCKLIRDTPLTVRSWDKQKAIFADSGQHNDLALGFATFFLNRTNRSGILNGGIIGGRDQTGPWKIDARFNREELIYRIESIAKLKDKIFLSRRDAIEFLDWGRTEWSDKTLIYLDPPYYKKGRDLYYDFYVHEDHERVAHFVREQLGHLRWIVSYDNVPQIRALYKGRSFRTYGIGYSARVVGEGSEVMFFSNALRISPLVGAMRAIGGSKTVEKRAAVG